ncbi:MAG: TIR domain-containing protein [Hyphomicrobium sp.]|nr:TIR domain-containing protein [Hyphomicrobium sp.]
MLDDDVKSPLPGGGKVGGPDAGHDGGQASGQPALVQNTAPGKPKAGEPSADQLTVFISYSRRDCLAFSKQLSTALTLLGHVPIMDLQNISGAEEWKPRLRELILEADTVVFVMSPESAVSPVCAWEVEEAGRLAKRIIPVIAMPLGDAKPPEGLQRLNYIYFYAEKDVPDSGFGDGLAKLDSALKSDLGWLREHRALLLQAEAWLARNREPDRLLRGGPLAAAERWAASRPLTAPDLTETQRAYLEASRSAEDETVTRRRAELEERARILAEAEAAQREAQAQSEKAAALERQRISAELATARAQSEAADLAIQVARERQEAAEAREKSEVEKTQASAAKALARRTRNWLMLAVLLAFAAGGAGLFAWRQANIADGLKATAQRAESGLLASAASALIDSRGFGSVGGAALLALEALPDKAERVKRSSVPEAEVQLSRSLRHLRERLVLTGHTGAVRLGALSADGNKAVTFSDDGTARLWDTEGGREVKRIDLGGQNAQFAVFSPDGSQFVLGLGFGPVRIFRSANGEQIGLLEGHWGGVISARYDSSGTRVVTTSVDNTARIWDTTAGKQVQRLDGHTNFTVAAAFNKDGTKVVTGSNDTTVRVWNVESGQEIVRLSGYGGNILNVAFVEGENPNDENVVSTSADGTVRVWRVSTGEELERLPTNGSASSRSGAYTSEPVISPNGRLALIGAEDGSANVWDLTTFESKARLDTGQGGVTAPAFNSDATRILTVIYDNAVGIWDAASGEYVEHLDAHRGRITSATLSADGNRILTTSQDGTARLWDLTSEFERVYPLANAGSLTMASARLGNPFVAAVLNDDSVGVWRLETGERVGTIQPLKDNAIYMQAASVNWDGSLVATAYSDGRVGIWSLPEGRETVQLLGHTSEVMSIAWSRDGLLIATASRDGSARIFDTRGNRIHSFPGHAGTVSSVDFNADGSLIVTASDDRTAHTWDTKTGEAVLRLLGHSDAVGSAAFSPDGTRIVTASVDRSVRVWDARDGSELVRIDGRNSQFLSATFSSDGRQIVTIATDGVARLSALSPDGRTAFDKDIAISGRARAMASVFDETGTWTTIWGDGIVRRAKTFDTVEKLVETAKERLHRCLAPVEREFYFLGNNPPAWCERRKLWPYDTGSMIHSANLYNSENRFAKALDEAQLALDLSGREGDQDDWLTGSAHLARGQAREGLGKTAGAEADFAEAHRRGLDVSLHYLQKARQLLLDRSREEAFQAFDTAVAWATRPGAPPGAASNAYFLRGRAYAEASEDDKAHQDFAKCDAIYLVEIVGHYLMKGINIASSDAVASEDAFEKALYWARNERSAPELSKRVLVTRALIRDSLGGKDKALADLDAAGADAVPMIVGIYAARAMNNFGVADAAPPDPALGPPPDLQMSSADFAVNWSEKPGASKLDKADALIARGNLHAERGNLEKALADYAVVNSLDVVHSQARPLVARVRATLARKAFDLGMFSDALGEISQASDLTPKMDNYRILKSVVEAHLDKCDDALLRKLGRHIKSYFELDRADLVQLAELHLARGHCREKLGYPAGAIADYKKALKRGGLGLSERDAAKARERLQALGQPLPPDISADDDLGPTNSDDVEIEVDDGSPL